LGAKKQPQKPNVFAAALSFCLKVSPDGTGFLLRRRSIPHSPERCPPAVKNQRASPRRRAGLRAFSVGDAMRLSSRNHPSSIKYHNDNVLASAVLNKNTSSQHFLYIKSPIFICHLPFRKASPCSPEHELSASTARCRICRGTLRSVGI